MGKVYYGCPWYDITYKEQFEAVVEDIVYQLSQTIVLLSRKFEKDFKT